jgi:uncharacterized protein
MNYLSLKRQLKSLTVIQNDSQAVLYDRGSLTLLPVAQQPALLLAEVLQNVDYIPPESAAWEVIDELLKNYSASIDFNPLKGLAPPPPPVPGDLIRNNIDPHRYLNKLAINIANDCNLACTYCYANEGLYGTPERSLITPDEVEAVVMSFANRFDYIENVQFMGGEPSMNPGAIQRTGEVFERLVAEGKLPGFPQFVMVSNGLRFTRTFLEVVKRFKAKVTISLDGPPEVHDFIRIKTNGSGSYDAIRRTIKEAQCEGIEIDFEPTFSKRHLDCGVHLIDLCQWFYDEFGVPVLHAPPMSENRYGTEPLALSAEDKIVEFCAVTEWGLDNIFERGRYLMHSFTERLIGSFDTRTPNKSICPAGNSMLSVSTKGEVSPCWMFTDEEPFVLGHIADADLLGDHSRRVLENLHQYELHSHPECRACYMQPVCFGCKGGDYHSTGSLDGKTNCDYMRAMLATFIMRVFSRPILPEDVSGYFKRPLFGEQIFPTLRPRIEYKASAIPLIQIQRFKPADIPRA